MHLSTRLSTLLILNIICLGLLTMGMKAYGQVEQTQPIDRLEKQLLFGTYTGDDMPTRLSRLEIQVFGVASKTGTPDERFKKLIAIVPLKNDIPTASVPSSRGSYPSAADSAIQRASVDVKAAKDLEIEDMLKQAVAFYRAKQSQLAIDKFDEVLQMDPNNAQANYSLGIIEEARGSLVEALSNYRLAAQANPDNADYQRSISAVKDKLTKIAQMDPKQMQIRQLAVQGTESYKNGDYLTALKVYQQLDQLSPNQPLVIYNIGTIYFALHQMPMALQCYTKACQLKPNEQLYVQARDKLQASLAYDNK